MQRIFPRVLQTFLPFAIPTAIAWAADLCAACLIGFAICILFALPPLLRFRRFSPLLVLRASVDVEPRATGAIRFSGCIYAADRGRRDRVSPFRKPKRGPGDWFSPPRSELAVGIFAGVAKLLMIRRAQILPAPLEFRFAAGTGESLSPEQSHAAAHALVRPGHFSAAQSLSHARSPARAVPIRSAPSNQPNIFLFDIQPDQKDAVADIVRSARNCRLFRKRPSSRCGSWKSKGRKTCRYSGRSAAENSGMGTGAGVSLDLSRAIDRTRKKSPHGHWIGRVDYHPGDAVPISLDEEIAKDFGAKIGDELVFDVQGVPIKTKIASLREVDWKRFQTNFFVVFPAGFWKTRPTFHVLVSRVATPADSARLQNAVVAKFPNVSAIDLTVGDPNRRFDSEQSRARHSRHVALHRRRRDDRAREHDLERALSATEGKHSAAHARRVARADLENSLRRIFFSRRCSPARPGFFWRSFRAGRWRSLFSNFPTLRRLRRCSWPRSPCRSLRSRLGLPPAAAWRRAAAGDSARPSLD